MRNIFPSPFLATLGFSLFILCLGLVSVPVSLKFGHIEGQLFWIKGWALCAAAWWPLMGTRLCNLTYQMTAARLPGAIKLLRNSLFLHVLLNVGLPLLVLLLWQPEGINKTALAAALALGSMGGLLIISMPVVIVVIPFLIIIIDWDLMIEPVFSATLALLALLMVYLAWYWQLSKNRSAFFAPFGVWLDDGALLLNTKTFTPASRQVLPSTSSFSQTRDTTRQGNINKTTNKHNHDVLPSLLGPTCQTLRQLYGPRGQWLGYGIFAAITSLLLYYEHFWHTTLKSNSVFWGVVFISLFFMVIEQSSRTLLTIRHKQQVQLAELHLLPGTPSRQWLKQALMRQIMLCSSEKTILLALSIPAILNLFFTLGSGWGIWWACFIIMLLVYGYCSVWLTLHGYHKKWPRITVYIVFYIMSITTNSWLLSNNKPLPNSLLWLWLGFGLLALLLFGRALHLRKHNKLLGLHDQIA